MQLQEERDFDYPLIRLKLLMKELFDRLDFVAQLTFELVREPMVLLVLLEVEPVDAAAFQLEMLTKKEYLTAVESPL